MTDRSMKYSAIAGALVACLAFTSLADAGGYAGNGCIAKKQLALGTHAKMVAKAWAKFSSDIVLRNNAIAASAAKLAAAWTKAEQAAVSKNATCDESTTDAATAAAAVSDAIAALSSGAAPIGAYTADAMKAWSKYIKDPTKDPGKAKLTAALGAAVTKDLSGKTLPVSDAATGLESSLVELTTTAPNYPTTFQDLVPGDTVMYGKTDLHPACIDGNPYMYFARKGSSNNVLMYYQGGGACWSTDSCFTVGTCARTADATDNPDLFDTGFGDYNNPGNPFYDWSVVFVSYCTCDVHWGDNTKTYAPGDVARHRGRVNAAVAEKWAREHFVDPARVFVTGSSAGSYGAMMNSYWLMKDVWPNADFSVLGDAGVGIITSDWINSYIKNWGLEKNLPRDLPGVGLPVETLSIVDLVSGMAERFPNARFANYDSSYDGGSGSQTNFFQVMRHPSPPTTNILDYWGSYWESACEWNACMRDFKQEISVRAPNYRLFTGAGSRHTIFGSDKIYAETKSRTAAGAGVTFASWVSSMIADGPGWVNVDCNNPGGDCNLTNTCQGGTDAGLPCTGGCPGGTCDNDPDSANPPYNNDDTVTCSPSTTCPCTEVRCPTFTP